MIIASFIIMRMKDDIIKQIKADNQLLKIIF